MVIHSVSHTVELWNSSDDSWKNGMFSLYIEGERLFDVVDVFELRTTFSFYLKCPISDLCVNDSCVSSVDVYRNAESYFTGDGEYLIGGLFDMTCTAMGDNGCYLYYIKTSLNDRLVWSVDDGKSIRETLLPSGAIQNVINQLNNNPLYVEV